MRFRETFRRGLASIAFSGVFAGLTIAVGADTPPASNSPDAEQSKPLSPLSPELVQLRNRLRGVLATYAPKHLDASERSCWEVMHGIIGYGVNAQLFRSGPGSPKVNAVGWMCYNQPCHGEQLFYLDRGTLVARRGPGLQGHLGQFLAIVAQSHVPADFPMQVGGKKFTLQDLINHEKSDCREGEELTFKLIGLSHYLDSDAEWTTTNGQKWNIPRLIREELKQPILRVAACGGNHRLMGHSYALYKRRKQGKPIDGQFLRAEKFIADYHRYTWGLQNADGSFSTRWFEGREAKPDLDRRLKTTGHTLEWMAFSIPEEQLQAPRMVKAVNYLVDLLAKNSNREWEVGPRGHAIHALRIYDRRLFKPRDLVTPTSTPTEPPAAAKAKAPEQTTVTTAKKLKSEPAEPRVDLTARPEPPKSSGRRKQESPRPTPLTPAGSPEVPPIEFTPSDD